MTTITLEMKDPIFRPMFSSTQLWDDLGAEVYV